MPLHHSRRAPASVRPNAFPARRSRRILGRPMANPAHTRMEPANLRLAHRAPSRLPRPLGHPCPRCSSGLILARLEVRPPAASVCLCQAPWGPCVRGSTLGLAARARASSLHRAHDCTDCALETRAVLVRCSFGADGRTRGLAGAILSASVARVCFCRRWASQELQSCSRHGQACARRQRCDIEY